MRRFSKRNQLVTLSDINITPLLDLAFVLLIIFVITAPLLEQSIELRLPEGGRASRRTDRENVKVVEIQKDGQYRYDGRPIGLQELGPVIAQAARVNPNYVLRVRGDRETAYKHVSPVLDLCAQQHVSVSLATEPPSRR